MGAVGITRALTSDDSTSNVRCAGVGSTDRYSTSRVRVVDISALLYSTSRVRDVDISARSYSTSGVREVAEADVRVNVRESRGVGRVQHCP